MKKTVRPLSENERIAAEILEAEQNLRLENYIKTGHAPPKTRREFLASGLISFASSICIPTGLQLLSNTAHAAGLSSECAKLLDPVAGWTPYIHVRLKGGAAIHYNSLVLGKNRELLPRYTRLGLGLLSAFNTRNEFGNVPLAVNSAGQFLGPMMAGLFERAGTAVNKTAMVKFCVRSQDDANSNRDSITGLVNAAGLIGTTLPNLWHKVSSNPSAFIKASSAQRVGTVSGLVSALQPQGAIKASIAEPKFRQSFLSLIQRLNAAQRGALAISSSGRAIGQLFDCSSSKNIDLASFNPNELDPRAHSAIAAVWGINSETADDDESAVQAAVVMNALKGNSGAAKFDIGGYDYHGLGRPVADANDLKGGRFIGQVLKSAEAMNKPVFIHVTSDGSAETSSESNTVGFGADAGIRGSGFFLAFDPRGRPATSDVQIGHFNDAQAVDETFINTWTTERAALSVFANYLKLHNRLGDLEKLTPGQFDLAQLNKLIKFA